MEKIRPKVILTEQAKRILEASERRFEAVIEQGKIFLIDHDKK